MSGIPLCDFKLEANAEDRAVWQSLEDRLTKPCVERRDVQLSMPEITAAAECLKTIEELEAEAICAEACGQLR